MPRARWTMRAASRIVAPPTICSGARPSDEQERPRARRPTTGSNSIRMPVRTPPIQRMPRQEQRRRQGGREQPDADQQGQQRWPIEREGQRRRAVRDDADHERRRARCRARIVPIACSAGTLGVAAAGQDEGGLERARRRAPGRCPSACPPARPVAAGARRGPRRPCRRGPGRGRPPAARSSALPPEEHGAGRDHGRVRVEPEQGQRDGRVREGQERGEVQRGAEDDGEREPAAGERVDRAELAAGPARARAGANDEPEHRSRPTPARQATKANGSMPGVVGEARRHAERAEQRRREQDDGEPSHPARALGMAGNATGARAGRFRRLRWARDPPRAARRRAESR